MMMRTLLMLLLSTLLCLALPIAALAGDGAAGHRHDHGPGVASDDEHQATSTGADHSEHDHGAHAWQAPEEEKKRPNPISASAESIANGQKIFRHYCITCHGYDADGNTMRGQNLNPRAANLREMAGHHSDGDYHYKIRTGHGPMPHWGKTISEKNIWHLVNYLQSLAPDTAAGEGHDQHQQTRESLLEKPGHHDHSSHKH